MQFIGSLRYTTIIDIAFASVVGGRLTVGANAAVVLWSDAANDGASTKLEKRDIPPRQVRDFGPVDVAKEPNRVCRRLVKMMESCLNEATVSSPICPSPLSANSS